MTGLWRHPAVRVVLLLALLIPVAAGIAVVLRPIAVPLLGAVVLYAVLDPVVCALVRIGIGRVAAIVCVLMGLFGLLVAGLVALAPALAVQVGQLQNRMPQIWEALARRVEALGAWLQQQVGVTVNTTALADAGLAGAEAWGVSVVGVATDVAAGLASFAILVPLISFFLLRDYRGLRDRGMNGLPHRGFELGWIIYRQIARRLDGYVRGVFVQSLVMATVTGIGFGLLGIDLAILLGVLAGLLNVIPYVGPLLAMVPPLVLVGAAPEPSLWMALAAIGVVMVGQVVDNVIVVPLVIAQAADLHPLTVLIGVIVFGQLFGFLGMILAIPALFSAKILLLGLIRGVSAATSDRTRGASAEGDAV